MNVPDVKMIPYILGGIKKSIADLENKVNEKTEKEQISLAEGMTKNGNGENSYIVNSQTGVVTVNISVNFNSSSSYKNLNDTALPAKLRPKNNLVYMVMGGALHETRLVVDTDGMIKFGRTYNISGRTEVSANTQTSVITSISYLP